MCKSQDVLLIQNSYVLCVQISAGSNSTPFPVPWPPYVFLKACSLFLINVVFMTDVVRGILEVKYVVL